MGRSAWTVRFTGSRETAAARSPRRDCGFNDVPAHAISYTEMWMPYNFDPTKMDKELALAKETGFNCLRVVLPFVVWEHDPEAFKKQLNAFLQVCDRRVWVWDLYNEPTNGGLGDVSLPLTEKVFEWARAVNPAHRSRSARGITTND